MAILPTTSREATGPKSGAARDGLLTALAVWLCGFVPHSLGLPVELCVGLLGGAFTFGRKKAAEAGWL